MWKEIYCERYKNTWDSIYCFIPFQTFQSNQIMCLFCWQLFGSLSKLEKWKAAICFMKRKVTYISTFTIHLQNEVTFELQSLLFSAQLTEAWLTGILKWTVTILTLFDKTKIYISISDIFTVLCVTFWWISKYNIPCTTVS